MSFLQAGQSGMGKGLSLKMLLLILKRIGVLASPGSGFGSLSFSFSSHSCTTQVVGLGSWNPKKLLWHSSSSHQENKMVSNILAFLRLDSQDGSVQVQCNVFEGASGEVSLTSGGGLRQLPGLSDTYENAALVHSFISFFPLYSLSLTNYLWYGKALKFNQFGDQIIMKIEDQVKHLVKWRFVR